MEWNQRRRTQWVTLAMIVGLALVGRNARVQGQAAADKSVQVTFAKDIAPILQRSCQSCHQPNSVAPMSLMTYEEVRPWARSIKHRISLGSRPDVMPPWFIDKSIGIQHYKDDMSLSDAEVAKVAAWVDAGSPRGNAVDMPPLVKALSASEWRLGKPDLIVSSPSAQVDPVAPDWWGPLGMTATGLTEDRYVASVEIKEVTESVEAPASSDGPKRQTVGGQFIIHHLAYMALDGKNQPLMDSAGQWPVHEVGRNPDVFDPEAGKLLPAGSKISFMSTHVHANGRKTKARVDIGFRFHPKGYKPAKKFSTWFVNTRDIDLRGNEANQKLEAFLTLKENTQITIFEPHLHAAGVRQCLDAIWGTTIETLSCAGYNHGWVRVYNYADDAQPLLPKGTILRVTSFFDTTSANKNVSDPRNWTGLGNRSLDNMAQAVVSGMPLTDQEFESEMAKRRDRLRLSEGETVIGCPLCGYRKKVPAAVARR
jgi:hypothetical protein